MEKPQAKNQLGSKTATDEEIKSLVAQTLLSRAIQRHQKNSDSNSKPSPTPTGKKPSE